MLYTTAMAAPAVRGMAVRHTAAVSTTGGSSRWRSSSSNMVSKATKTPMNQPQTTSLSALVRRTMAVNIRVVTTAITNVDEVTIRAKSSGGVCMLR